MWGKIIASLFVISLAVGAADFKVYDDQIRSPFADWGWAATKNPAYTAKVRSGTNSYSFVPISYQAAYFAAPGFISTSTYSALEFYIYRSSGSSTNVNLNLIRGGNPVGDDKNIQTYISGGTWNENTWTKVTLPFSRFASGTYDGFWVQDKSGSTANTAVQIDDIVLIGGSGSSSSSTSTTTTTTSTSAKATTSTTSTTGSATTSTTSTTTKSTTTTTTGSTTGGTGQGDSKVADLYNKVSYGDGTYYGAYGGGGACLLDDVPTVPTVEHTVAIGAFWDSKTCGMCIELSGNGKGLGANPINRTRVVYVNNQCPECSEGSLDLAINGDGRWEINWKAVPCPITSKIQYKFKEGSTVYWLGIQARNTVYPVYKLELRIGSSWVNVPRERYNYFVTSPSGLTKPFKVRLTDVKGHIVEDTINDVVNGVLINGGVQFPV